jgi:hypothetical protein
MAGMAGAGGPTLPPCQAEATLPACGTATWPGEQVQDCRLALSVVMEDPGNVSVLVDCALITRYLPDAGDAFVVDPSANTVTLTGQTCAKVRNGVERVDVVLGCAMLM